MPPEEADRDPHGRLEAGGGGGGSTPEPGPIPNEHAPPGALASLARVSSSMSVARSAVSEVVEREIEEADLMGNEELVRELATPGPRFAPLKTAREMTAAVAAPYGPDEPMSLQNVLRGQGASVFVMNYVPSIGQSMAKVKGWLGISLEIGLPSTGRLFGLKVLTEKGGRYEDWSHQQIPADVSPRISNPTSKQTALQIRDRIHVPYLPCIRTLQNYTGGVGA